MDQKYDRTAIIDKHPFDPTLLQKIWKLLMLNIFEESTWKFVIVTTAGDMFTV